MITDGETARVSWQPTGTTPQFGMRCRIPGQGQGSGMSLPTPIDPRSSAQNELPLPLEAQAAQIMAGLGVKISGYAEAGINLVCSAPK